MVVVASDNAKLRNKMRTKPRLLAELCRSQPRVMGKWTGRKANCVNCIAFDVNGNA